MGTSRGFDRLVFFTDAVTAIAITLLILPLVDLIPEYVTVHGRSGSVGGFVTENLNPLWAFALSFAIIARLWLANHRTLEYVERQTGRLMTLDLVWAFTVVVLPLPTALIASLPTDAASVGFYVGTMTASSILLSALSFEVYRTPQLDPDHRERSLLIFVGTVSNSVAFVVALALGVLVPGVGYAGLLLLLLTIPSDAIIKPRVRARLARNALDTPRG